MNGVHDMGGMHGMGPFEPESNEPVFHEPWEGRVYALVQSVGPWGRGRKWGSFRSATGRSTSIRCVSRPVSCGATGPLRATRSMSIYGSPILGPPDRPVAAERLQALPPLPRDEEGPVCAEPWQAQAFALAVELVEQGHFTWKEWAGALADELKTAEASSEPDDGSQYYHHWVAALGRLVTAKGLTDAPVLLERKEAWAEACRHTPHGKPVTRRRT